MLDYLNYSKYIFFTKTNYCTCAINTDNYKIPYYLTTIMAG